MNKDNYMGYNLFLEVEDTESRDRNRGQVMLNIFEDHCQDRRVGPAGMVAILGYFKGIPADERMAALEQFKAMTTKAGYNGPVLVQ